MRLRPLFRASTLWPRRLVFLGMPLWLMLTFWSDPKGPENPTPSAWLPPIELSENVQVTPSTSTVDMPNANVTPVNDERALHSALSSWIETWSAKDVAAYLGFYSPDFVPPRGLSKTTWARLRVERISSKQRIDISFEKLRLQINGTWATVKFTQVYQDERLRRHDQKTMVWQKRGGQWLIQSETTE